MAVTIPILAPAVRTFEVPSVSGASPSASAEVTTVVEMSGEFDLSARSLLSDALAGGVAKGGDLIIDLTETTFVDTATVRTIADCHRLIAGHGRRLTLRSPQQSAVKVITLFGLRHLIEIPSSRFRRTQPS